MKNRLKVLRAERDWTQADLADRAGVARQTIVALENEKYSPSLELAFKFASLFGTRVDEIFHPPAAEATDGRMTLPAPVSK
jgi:putative transcriptional regulator